MISDASFMQNVHEARFYNYDFVCAMCGSGMSDEEFEDPDWHAPGCPNRGRDRHAEWMAMVERALKSGEK